MSVGKAVNIGDYIIKTLPVITGAKSFDSLSDSISTESAERYFEKSFSYAIEGLLFTDFQTLNDANLQAIQIDPKRSYLIQVKYVRSGSDVNDILVLNSVEIIHTDIDWDNGFEFDNSNFVKFFDSKDSDVELWAMNVLKKVYGKGVLAEFIQRGNDISSSLEDTEDFVVGLATDDDVLITTDDGDYITID